MKKIVVLALVVLFSLSVTVAFAGDAPQSKGKAASQSGSKGPFQAASNDISKMSMSVKSAKDLSLREDKEEFLKRRCRKGPAGL